MFCKTAYEVDDWLGWPELTNGYVEIVDGIAAIRQRHDASRRLALALAGAATNLGLRVATGAGIRVNSSTVIVPDVCVLVDTGRPDTDTALDLLVPADVEFAIDIDDDGSSQERLERLLDHGTGSALLVASDSSSIAFKTEPPPDWVIECILLHHTRRCGEPSPWADCPCT